MAESQEPSVSEVQDNDTVDKEVQEIENDTAKKEGASKGSSKKAKKKKKKDQKR